MERKTSDRLIKIVVAVVILFFVWEGGRSSGKTEIKESASYLIGLHIMQQYGSRCVTNPKLPKETFQACIRAVEDQVLDQYRITRE